MITFTNVSKTFKTDKGDLKAVNQVSLTIEDKEIFGIIGYSGAGKSTLLRMINQLEKQDDGTIKIHGVDIAKLTKKQLLQRRTKIGMIFQHFNLLWSRTVYDNIALPLEIAGVKKEEIKNKVNQLIQLVDLDGRENSYPNTLSGGQKQRVAIARALANDPDILLCDEATSALDPQTTDSILALLKKINQQLGITMVLITHQMEVAEKLCHRIAVMVDGKVVEYGNTIDLFENPQHEATKRFVRTRAQLTDESQLSSSLKQIYNVGHIVRLTFHESIAKQPILANVMKTTGVNISIVHANISNTINSSFGTMYVHIDEINEDKLAELLEQFIQAKVVVEVI